MVGIRRIDVGARVDDETVLTTLDDLSEIEIEFRVPEIFFGQVRRGQLVQVLPQWQSPEDIVHCIYPSRRGMMPAVRALLDFLSERLPSMYQRLEKAASPAPQ